ALGWGRSCARAFVGSLVGPAGGGVSAQAGTLASTTCRRHLPIWMTSGTFAPAGTPGSTKWPLASETVWASGVAPSTLPQGSQVTPAGRLAMGPSGTETSAVGGGRGTV